MGDWSRGYEVSEGYTYGFVREMAPDWLDLCARLAGFAPSRSTGAPFRYCELGTGQGLGLCLLAAANPGGEFVGIDFMPEHVAHARGLAAAAGLGNVRFLDADFVALAHDWPSGLGDFDYVALHGVWSWVAPAVREALVRCLEHATRPGSLVYAAYNAQPGWLSAAPFQHVAQALGRRAGRRAGQRAGKPGVAVLEEAVDTFDRLRVAGAPIFQSLPGLRARLDWVRSRPNAGQTHEYLNAHWQPAWHSHVAAALAEAKLRFVGTATLPETLLPAMLPPSLGDVVKEQTDPALREDLQDIAINQTFRRDVFCRGLAPAFARDFEIAGSTRLHLLTPPEVDEILTIETAFGDATLPPGAYLAIVSALREGPRSLAELPGSELPGSDWSGSDRPGSDWAETIRTVLLLLEARTLALGAGTPGEPSVAQRLNGVIAAAAVRGAPYKHVACAALGSAVAVSETDLILFDSWLTEPEPGSDRGPNPSDAVAFARRIAERLARVGRSIQQDGQPLAGDAAVERLLPVAQGFIDTDWPRWRALGALV